MDANKLQIVTYLVKNGDLSDDLKGVNTCPGTAFFLAVPIGDLGKCKELKIKFQLLIFGF